ncbi:probable nucleoredoxin 1 [Vigna radiata var. radiata]|uniref:protein-disulfide reductase n=1 Tax=Vigna radiata var. radiata TaxID=3916 RepID=A0A1S3VZH9_VIGRR|nr:probable nucleoredoxin 1 [Vigna radiata var. radiata]
MAASADVTHDVVSLLSSPERDYLLRNNGDQVKIENLKGKKVGIYFSASWCGPCRKFTPTLVEAYDEVVSKGDFEVVFASADEDDEAFKGYFSKMPWLAIPFSDSETRSRLDELFQVRGIPNLVLLDETGKVVTEDGVDIVREYGVEAYPFTSARIQELRDREEEARRNQSVRSLLISPSRDFVISSNGNNVPVSELEGKTVGLYFSHNSFGPSSDFTPKLVRVYEELKARGENFEVVLIPLDEDEESFKEVLGSVPWLSLPFKDKFCGKLAQYFELSTLPTLVILGPDGKTLNSNVAEAIEDHGVVAYPFTPEKFAELDEILKAREAAQTLESILVSEDLDFVIGKDGVQVPVSELNGKVVLLYFSAHWCPPCRAFLPKLVDAYHEIKAKGNALEIVFISSDKDQASFDEFFGGMPWLALPFGDSRKRSLSRKFRVSGIPMLVAIGSSGRTLTTKARDLVLQYGARAYPFTDEKIKELEAEEDEIAKGWPEKLTHETHEHELALTRRKVYYCDGCNEQGHAWSYYCEKCDFDLHPKCVLKEDKVSKDDDTDVKEEDKSKDGWVCDGEVCKKV